MAFVCDDEVELLDGNTGVVDDLATLRTAESRGQFRSGKLIGVLREFFSAQDRVKPLDRAYGDTAHVIDVRRGARGLTDEELAQGWQLYSDLHGFGAQAQARAATKETAAAQAINAIDAWDAPAYSAAHAVLDVRHPEVSRFLFENLEANVGVAAVAGVQRFLNRIDTLRDGKAPNIDPETARSGIELLATRKIVDTTKAAELRQLIETARLGARPDEVIEAPEMDPRRRDVAASYISWLNEWREVARVSVSRRDYRISLGIAQRRQASEEPDEPVPGPSPAQA